jgi:hypothetical protein
MQVGGLLVAGGDYIDRIGWCFHPNRLLKTTPNLKGTMVQGSMRGEDQQNHMFSYLSPEARVRKDHPLRHSGHGGRDTQ